MPLEWRPRVRANGLKPSGTGDREVQNRAAGPLMEASVSELARIREAAIAAAKRAYPKTAQEQAAYWDELLTSFIRTHGAELAAEVFGIELSTARALLYVSMFPARPTCSILARGSR
jgi:hypothetical protein